MLHTYIKMKCTHLSTLMVMLVLSLDKESVFLIGTRLGNGSVSGEKRDSRNKVPSVLQEVKIK